MTIINRNGNSGTPTPIPARDEAPTPIPCTTTTPSSTTITQSNQYNIGSTDSIQFGSTSSGYTTPSIDYGTSSSGWGASSGGYGASSSGYGASSTGGASGTDTGTKFESLKSTGSVELNKTNKDFYTQKMSEIAANIAERTQLSTTGYQTAMGRVQAGGSDQPGRMTLERANQYLEAAQTAYPDQPLRGLADFQMREQNANNNTVAPTEMTISQLSEAIAVCRARGFGNCDIQSLETGNQLYHELGIKGFDLVNNPGMSHNYLKLHPSDAYPKGAIVDPWLGHGVQDLGGNVFQRRVIENNYMMRNPENNITTNDAMKAWIETEGEKFVL